MIVGKFFKSLTIDVLITLIITSPLKYFIDFNEFPKIELTYNSESILDTSQLFYIIVFLFVYILIATFFSSINLYNYKLGRVCKQFAFNSYISHFASNGKAKFEFNKNDQMYNIELSLNNFNLTYKNKAFTTSADCGVILAKNMGTIPFYKGLSITDKKFIKFEIMKLEGTGQIGFAIKNIHGNELKYSLKMFGMENKLFNVWQDIKIDLDNYDLITSSEYDKMYIENISFFTNNNLSGTEKQVFRVRDIRIK